MRGGGGFSLECQVKVFKCVGFFFKKEKNPTENQRNQSAGNREKKSFMKSAAFMQWSGAEEGIRYGIHHLHQRASPGAKKKKKTAAGPSDAPRWAERIPTVSLYLALAGFWQRAAQQSLQQPSRYTSQSRSANRHQRLRRSMDETGQKGRKFCVEKSLFDQKKVPCYCEEVFFFFLLLSFLSPSTSTTRSSVRNIRNPHWVKVDFSGAEKKIVYICMFGRKRNKGLGVWPLTWEYQWGIGALRDVTGAEFHNNSNSKNYFQEVFWSEK